MIKTVCVYCASSAKVSSTYLSAAEQLGQILAKHNIHCIYGAGHIGLMGTLADSILINNGTITGIIPRFMLEQNWHHKGIERLIITETMHERKAQMAAMADAAIALPGGCGTLEELLEVITWKQLSLFPKPIIIINIDGYYNPLIEMLNKAIEEKFMRVEHSNLWQVITKVEDVLAAIQQTPKMNENGLNFAVV